MDYFFMNEFIFKIIATTHKNFVIDFLKSLDIEINDYDLFDIPVTSDNQKIDVLLFANNLIINIQFNNKEISLKRNKIYIGCIKSIMPDYQVIQLNINLFDINTDIENDLVIIKNLYNNSNEYIDFLTSKNPLNFDTKNKFIQEVINYFQKIDLNIFKKDIIKEHKIKEYLDNLLLY